MSNELERETVKLWRIWKTAHQMCADRGYGIAQHELDLSLEDFKRQYTTPSGEIDRIALSFHAEPTDAMRERYTPPATKANPDPQPNIGSIQVEFSGARGVGIADFKKFVLSVGTNSHHTGVLVVAGSITPSALKLIPTALPRVIETFHEQELLVNVTAHELVPKHVLLSVADKRALLDRYRVKETQLPRIQVTDPVARYLGLRRGQVVKIIRRSETAGRYASYRWCI